MRDTLVRDALLRHAADEPPMTYTSTDIIRAGRRSRRWHRGAAVAGSVLTAAALAGAALAFAPIATKSPSRQFATLPPGVPMWTNLDSAPFCATAATPVEPTMQRTSVINPKNGFPIAIPTEPVDHAAARFSCYLMHAVREVLAGAAFARDPNSPPQTVPLQAFASRVFDPTRPQDSSPPYYEANAVVIDDQGVGEVGFSVGPAAEPTADAIANCSRMCAVHSGPNGEVVTVLTVESDTGYRLVNINVYRGQTVAFASASNGVPIALAPGQVGAITDATSPPVGRADLPISVEDLIEILAAPQLTLFP